jgi:hypothetical protein
MRKIKCNADSIPLFSDQHLAITLLLFLLAVIGPVGYYFAVFDKLAV